MISDNEKEASSLDLIEASAVLRPPTSSARQWKAWAHFSPEPPEFLPLLNHCLQLDPKFDLDTQNMAVQNLVQ
jgi:hypothetical protein